jgi:N-acetylglucosaminyldiphosphoundecaprenol N-acetyl-beta-D-mannosaminyltransferase
MTTMPSPRASAPAAPGPRVEVLGCSIDALTMEETVARCAQLVERGAYSQHMAINAAKLVKLRDDAWLADIVAGCELVNADGQAVVWASRALGAPLPERVAGVDLMQELFGLAEARGWPIFILGAKREVLDAALAVIGERHPTLVIAGSRDGYFADEEVGGVCDEIRASGARMLFVAMGTPRKEYFLGEHGPTLGVPFVMGVGGSIDIVAGITKRAPVIWQRAGLEWLYRLLQEPQRMLRRYITTNTQCVVLVARQALRRRAAR